MRLYTWMPMRSFWRPGWSCSPQKETISKLPCLRHMLLVCLTRMLNVISVHLKAVGCRWVLSADNLFFYWFDSLCFINNLSVIKGQVFLGWTSTKLGLMFLLKDTTQWRRWGSNPRPLGLKSSTLHWVTAHRITLQTVWSQIRPDTMSGLICLQTVWHSDCIPARIFQKIDFNKCQQRTKK